MTEQPSNGPLPVNIAEDLRLALALHQQGQLNEAHALYERILRVDPGHADALHLLGIVAYQQRQFGQAVALISRAIASNPQDAAFYANRGIVRYELRQLDAAIADFDKAIAIKPDYAEAYSNRGNTRQELKQLDAALADFGKAIAIRPDYAEAYYNRGNTLRALGRLEAAIGDYGNAIAIKPDYAAAFNNRGNTLQELKRFDAAMADFDKAIALAPDYAAAFSNRGNAHKELKQLDAAIADYGKALAIKPDYAEAFYNRGNVLREQGKLDAAIADFDKAIAVKPDYASAYWNKGLALLLGGDLKSGFELYEWRWKNPTLHMALRRLAQPLWLGDQPLRDKTILLHSEQGLGDTIQFCRYAALAARAGARVILQVPKPLVSLLKTLDGASLVLAEDETLPDFDYHCPLLSLPLAFKTVLATIPDPTPYLYADPAKARDWQERIREQNKLRVGVVWSGGFRADAPEGWDAVNESRNLSLDLFARAVADIDAAFFSLQKGDPAESEIRGRELEYWPRGNFDNFAGDIKDFADTAALIANLDLVLSVDTATAHLAAALGKPVWILNRLDPDWRWLLDRDDSPWYRSVKLYRQDASQSWEPVLRRVAADLTQLAHEHRAGR